MADNPKLEMSDSCDSYGSENKIGTQKISVLDHVNGFQYESTDKSDSFVIDMESFCHGTKKDCTPNSRITLQRNLSRKGSMPMRSSDKKINTNFNTNKCSNDRDTITTIAALSPKGSSMPERPATAATVGSTDHSNKQLHNQITITTTTENRFPLRRNSFKRATPSWILDPKRVLLMFATLSSMGTILLIYFTLSISKISTDENVDWLQ